VSRVSPYPYRIVRTFPLPGTDEERVLSKVYELPLPPHRGQDVLLPDEVEPRRIARVIQQARPAVKAEAWQPGFTVLEWVTVELEADMPDQYEPAVAAGWTPA
jgi:hypothetical protein